MNKPVIIICLLAIICASAAAQETARQAFSDGRRAFNAEKYEEALKLFNKAAETDPGNAEVHIWRGNALLALGRIDEAAEAWKQALKIAPDNASLKARLERLSGSVKDIDREIAAVQELLDLRLFNTAYLRALKLFDRAKTPQHRAALDLLIAEAMFGKGLYDKVPERTAAFARRYPGAKPDEILHARILQGRALAAMNKVAEARDYYNFVLAQPNAGAYGRQAQFELGRLLEKEGRFEDALQAYLKVIAQATTGSDRSVRLSAVSAINLLMRLAEKEGVVSPATHLNKHHKQALEIIIKACSWSGEPYFQKYIDYLRRISNCYIKTGSPEVAAKAIESMRNALKPDSKHARFRRDLWIMLGETYMVEGANAFNRNLKMHGDFAEQKTPNAAFLKALKTCLSQVPARPDAKSPAILMAKRIAVIYEKTGRFDPAIFVYKEIIKKAPANEIKLELARLYFLKEKNDTAKLSRSFKTVPRKLGASAENALLIIKSVAAGEINSKIGIEALDLASRIAGFYADLGYYDVAQNAYGKLATTISSAGNPLAHFILLGQANITRIEADKDFNRRAAMFGGITELSVLHKKALALYLPVAGLSSPDNLNRMYCAAEARRQVESIAAMYHKQAAYDAAREAFLLADGNAQLALTGRMRYLAAKCLMDKASHAFGEWRVAAKPGDKPDALSAEYKAAIADYVALLAAKPQSPYAPSAFRDIREIALTYARSDAWNIASSVYAVPLKKELAYSRPEQVRFEQALCEIGKAMRNHAIEMLSLTAKEPTLSQSTSPAVIFSLSAIYKDMTAYSRDELITGTGFLDMQKDISAEFEVIKSLRLKVDKAAASGKRAESRKFEEEYNEKLSLLELKKMKMQMMEKLTGEAPRIPKDSYLYDASLQRNLKPTKHGGVAYKPSQLPLLTEEEIQRQSKALNAAYAILTSIIRDNTGKPVEWKARGEIMLCIEHLRSIRAPKHAVEMLERYIKDNPKDGALPQLTLRAAGDYLAWASISRKTEKGPIERLKEIGSRFKTARAKYNDFIKAFPKETAALQTARRQLAESYLIEARIAGMIDPGQARGRYVRAAKELLAIALTSNGGDAAAPVWSIATELESRQYWEEAIEVYRMFAGEFPVAARARQANLRIANAYHNGTKDYLRAVEAYQEYISSGNGANGPKIQAKILEIGRYLQRESRWIEALHIYSVFIDSFPKHPQAAEALRAVGEIHQTNHSWEEAIKVYERVIDEYGKSKYTKSARMSIAVCHIQLSHWLDAMWIYANYIRDYPSDPGAALARRNIPILKDIRRFQQLIDEKRSVKIDEAQYEIARIVNEKLGNREKAIIEYEKLIKNHREKCHLVDDALFAAGTLYLNTGKLDKAHAALYRVFNEYPTSPLADDALFILGSAYEKKADSIASITLKGARVQARYATQEYLYGNTMDELNRMQQVDNREIADLRKAGKYSQAAMAQAAQGAKMKEARSVMAWNSAMQAEEIEESVAAAELANRRDRINAALRQAVKAYQGASTIALGDWADDSLLKMAEIYEKRLKDPEKAMEVYNKIVATFPGTAVAENAVWRRAEYYERKGLYKKAREEYAIFISNYPQSKRVGNAMLKLAEAYEHLKMWDEAMNTYGAYISKFSGTPGAARARERIIWIKTYRLYEKD